MKIEKDLQQKIRIFSTFISRQGFAEIAINTVVTNGIKKIGLSGGVAYNNIITKTLSEIIRKAGIEFITHKNTPPGDSGISIGQAYSALFIE